uniref:Ketoreductase (KR) domain-containing protein n=1 Tax=Mycena chlorophos TaxID=658473 RepID=A0ABQ0LFM8_MYCCL|nr:predicted protein [Mycena chlorophos]
MVLKIAAAASAYFPKEYTVHVVTAIVAIIIARVISQGRKTTRERDLHARVILLTGGFTPFGLTLLESLAKRGAHVIALTPYDVESEGVSTYINLLRSETSNEQIFAETCDLSSPPSIHAFGARFAKNQEQRIDAVVFTHEYRHLGIMGRPNSKEIEAQREQGALATFLLTTLLLPVLLTAPAERDIRLINVVNRFYPAAIPSFGDTKSFAFSEPTATKRGSFLAEGVRALRTVVFTRHLQRILDALPNAAPLPKPTEQNAAPVPVVRPGSSQRSNIVAVSVSPGLSRAETIAPLLGASTGGTVFGLITYALLYPFLFVFAKSAGASIETVLHALFLPTPFKILSAEEHPKDSGEDREVLKPGALYAECAVVRVPMRVEEETAAEAAASAPEKAPEGSGKEELKMPDDREFGGEVLGRRVWEAYEKGLREWNEANPSPPPVPEEKETRTEKSRVPEPNCQVMRSEILSVPSLGQRKHSDCTSSSAPIFLDLLRHFPAYFAGAGRRFSSNISDPCVALAYDANRCDAYSR